MSSHPARLLLRPGLTFSPFAGCRVPFQGSSGGEGGPCCPEGQAPPSAETWQGVGSGRHLKARAGHRQARWCSPGLRAACPRRVDMRCQDSAFPISPARTVPVCSDPPVPALALHEREGAHEGPCHCDSTLLVFLAPVWVRRTRYPTSSLRTAEIREGHRGHRRVATRILGASLPAALGREVARRPGGADPGRPAASGAWLSCRPLPLG